MTSELSNVDCRDGEASAWLRARFAVLVFLAILGLMTPVLAVFDSLPAICCPEPGPRAAIVDYAEQVRVWGLLAWGMILLAAAAVATVLIKRHYQPLGGKTLLRSRPGLLVARGALGLGLFWIARELPVGTQDSWSYAFFIANVWDFSLVMRSASLAVVAFLVSAGMAWRGHAPRPWVLPVLIVAIFGARNLGLILALAVGRPAMPF